MYAADVTRGTTPPASPDVETVTVTLRVGRPEIAALAAGATGAAGDPSRSLAERCVWLAVACQLACQLRGSR